MKKLLVILLCAALTACGPNNVNTPTFTQPSPVSTLTAAPTEISAPTPETVVTAGSDAEKAGIRVGAIAKKNPDGSYTYTFANPANDRTIENVGTAKIVGGKLVFEKAEFLNKQISTCGDMQAKMKDNQSKRLDLLDGVEKWDRSKVEGDGVNIPDVILNALVNDETPFPEGVLTGQKLVTRDYVTPDGSIDKWYMVWEEAVQKIMDANPDKRPYIQLGCVPVKTVTDVATVDANGKTTIKQVVETSIAVITKWLNPPDAENPKGSQVVVVTYVFANDYFYNSPPSDFVFSLRTSAVVGDMNFKFMAEIQADPKRNEVLEKWNSAPWIVPKEAELVGGFDGIGSEKNYQ